MWDENITGGGGIVDNIDKKIAEFDIKLKIMQMDIPKKYNGFAKELERKLDDKTLDIHTETK